MFVLLLAMHSMVHILLSCLAYLPSPRGGGATLRERWGKVDRWGKDAFGIQHRVPKKATRHGTGLVVTVILIGHSRPAGLLSALASVQVHSHTASFE